MRLRGVDGSRRHRAGGAAMTDEKIREILAMEAKATRGPWEVDVEDGELTRDIMVGIYDDAEMIATAYDTVEDAILIALARNHIRELCEEVLRLRAALSPFAMIGNPLGYMKRPNRLDVPFEWCEAAYRALE